MGGTFIDVALHETRSARGWRARTSVPIDPWQAFMAGLTRVSVLRGTTVATEMILASKGTRPS